MPAGMPATVEPRDAEVRRVVVHDKVVANDGIERRLDWQARSDEHQDAAGVVVHVVVLDNRVARILDLDAGNIVEYFIVRDMNVVTHAHVNSGVFNAAQDIVGDQAVRAEFRKDTVDARVDYVVFANQEVVTGLTHDGVAFVMLNLQVLDGYVVARVKHGVVEFPVAFHDRPLAVDDDATQHEIVFIDVDGFVVGAWVISITSPGCAAATAA